MSYRSGDALKLMLSFLLSMSLLVAIVGRPAFALPQGHDVVSGSADLQIQSDRLSVQQHTQSVIINYDSFNIANGELVEFTQPNGGVALNRVTGSHVSQIFGQLRANGHIFLLNPNGILFGETAQVDVAGLVASTLSISDDDFLAGRFKLVSDDTISISGIDNLGELEAREEGYIALIAPEVSNDGKIIAHLGQVVLAGADSVNISFDETGGMGIELDQATVDTLVENNGVIAADGGDIQLLAAQVSDVLRSVVNNAGVIEAQSLVMKNGRVFLTAGDVFNDGLVSASAAAVNASGGEVELRGDRVGQWGEIRADALGNASGGDVLLYAEDIVALGSESVTTANADRDGTGGNVISYSPDMALFRRGAQIEVRGGEYGGDGGFAEVSGLLHVEAHGSVDARAPQGVTGDYLIDPYDITISGSVTAAGSFDGGSPTDTFTPSGTGSNVLNSDITTALASANVLITTTGGGAENGDISVNADIDIDGGNGNTLTLDADRDINLSADIRDTVTGSPDAVNIVFQADRDINLNINSDIETTGGDITLNADRDATGGGRVYATSASLVTGGGNLTVGGGATPASVNAIGRSGAVEGVDFNGVTITTGAGNVSIRGQGYADGAADNLYGVEFNGSSLTTTSGTVNITGVGGAGVDRNYGAYFTGASSVSSATGNIQINGTGGSAGAATSDFNYGIRVSSGSSINSTGAGGSAALITMIGIGGAGATYNFGINLSDGDVASIDGNISLTGTGSTTGTSYDGGEGIRVHNGSTITSTGTTLANAATITLIGNGAAGDDFNNGIVIRSTGTSITSDAGAILLDGNAGSSGLAGSNSNYGILIESDGEVRSIGTGGTDAATITLDGLGGDGDAGNGGLLMRSGAVVTSVDGNVTVLAQGGTMGAATGSSNIGVQLTTDATLSSTGITADGATINITGTGADSEDGNYGVYVDGASAVISTAAGNITITGNGGSSGAGTSDANHGVFVFNGASILSTGTTTAGDIILNGTADAATATSGIGVRVEAATVESADGNISLTGSGYGTSGEGIYIDSTAIIRSTASGDLSFTGTSAVADDIEFESGSTQTITGGNASADIMFTANRIDFSDALTLSTTGMLTIQQRTNGTSIGVGNGVGTLQIDNTELALLTAGEYIWGNSDPATIGGAMQMGNISIVEEMTFYGTSIDATGDVTTNDLTLISSGDINLPSGTDLNSSGGNMILNSDRDATSGGRVDIRMSTLTTGGGNLTIGGGADPSATAAIGRSGATEGILLINSSFNTGAGNILLRGEGWSSAGTDNNPGIYGAPAGPITFTTTTGNITMVGTGGNSRASNDGVFFDATGTLTTDSGTISVTGVGRSSDTSATGANNYGIQASFDITSSGTGGATGTITLTGTGADGGGSGNTGIFYDGTITVNNADVSITGTGGGRSGGSANNHGVYWQGSFDSNGTGTDAGSVILDGRGGGGGHGFQALFGALDSIDGDITVIGIGDQPAHGGSADGIYIVGSVTFATTGATGDAGIISLTGTGSTAAATSHGIRLLGSLDTAAGNITLTGTATTASSDGIFLDNATAAVRTSGSGDISFTGSSASAVDIEFESGTTQTVTGGGAGSNITFTGNTMDFGDALTFNNFDTVTVRQRTNGTSIGIGNSATGTLNINSTELYLLYPGAEDYVWGNSSPETIGGSVDVDLSSDTGDTFYGTSITVSGLNSAGYITVISTDDITFDGTSTSNGAAFTVTADSDSSGAGDVIVNAGIEVYGNFDIDAVNLTMADTSLLYHDDDSNMDVDVTGTLTVGQIFIPDFYGSSSLTIDAAAIVDAGDSVIGITSTGDDIVANNAAATTTLTIGGAIPDIETNVAILAGSTTAAGNVSINETDSITVSSFATNDGSFTLTAGGDTTVTSVTTNDAGNNEVHSTSFTTTGGDLVVAAVTSDGALTVTSSQSIDIFGGAGLVANGGDITLNSDRDETQNDGWIRIGADVTAGAANLIVGGGSSPSTMPAYGGNNSGYGVFIVNATISAPVGSITIRGNGETAAATKPGHSGVAGQNSSIIAGTGNVSIYGTGASVGNDGIHNGFWSSNFDISTGDGNILIQGTAGTDGSVNSINNVGVLLGNDSDLVSTGAGSITITGFGANNPNNGAHGVHLSASSLQTDTGNITINGTGYGGTGKGIYSDGVSSFSTLSSGNILMTGTSASDIAIEFASGTNQTVSGATIFAAQQFRGDSMALNDVTISTPGVITIIPLTASTTMGVGNGLGTLRIDATQAANVSGGEIYWGDVNTGALQIGDINNVTDTYIEGASITITGDVTTDYAEYTSAGTMTMNAGTTISTSNDDVDIAVNVLTMNDTSVINTGSGGVIIDMPGALTLGSIVTTNATANAISIGAGSLVDGGDTAVDLIANSAGATTELTIVGPINDIETTLDTLTVSTTAAGDITINETDSITVTSISTFDGAITFDADGATTFTSITVGDNGNDASHALSVNVSGGDLNYNTVNLDGNFTTTWSGTDTATINFNTAIDLDGLNGSTFTINNNTSTFGFSTTTNFNQNIRDEATGSPDSVDFVFNSPGLTTTSHRLNFNNTAELNTGGGIFDVNYATSGQFSMADGTIIDAGAGTVNIDMNATTITTVSSIRTTNATTGAIYFQAVDFIDAGDTYTDFIANSVGARTTLQATSITGDLETELYEVALSGIGDITEVAAGGDLRVFTSFFIDGTTITVNDGDLTILSGGLSSFNGLNLVVNEVTPGTGDLLVQGALVASLGTPNQNLDISVDGDAVFTADGDITNSGSGRIQITSNDNGVITMADGTVFDAGSGVLNFFGEGNMTVGRLVSTSASAQAAYFYQFDAGAQLLDAGDTGGADIEVASGGIRIDEAFSTINDIEIDAAQLFINANGGGGDITLNESNTVQLDNVDNDGDFTLVAGGTITMTGYVNTTDSGSGGDITLTSTGGSVNLGHLHTSTGGDTITVSASSGGIFDAGVSVDENFEDAGSVVLSALSNIGDITDFGTAAGTPLQFDSVTAVSATTTDTGSEIFLSEEVPIAGSTFTPNASGDASLIVSKNDGTLDLGAGTFNISANDNLGLASTTIVTIPDVGITTGGDVYLSGASDVVDTSGRVLTISADDFYFTSGAAGGPTTLATTVASITGSLTAAGDLTVNETNAINVTSLATYDGALTITFNGASTFSSLTTGDFGDDQTHALTVTGTDAGAVTSTFSTINADHNVTITNHGGMTFDTAIDLDGMNGATFTVNMTDDDAVALTFEQDITDTATGSADSVIFDLDSQRGLSFNNTMTLNSYGANIDILVPNDSMTMADGTQIISGTGTITVDVADELTVGSLNSSNTTAAALSVTVGSTLIDGGDTHSDFVANAVGAVTALDVGDITGIETEVYALDLTGFGTNLAITEVAAGGDLIINRLNTGTPTTDSSVTVSSGSLTIESTGIALLGSNLLTLTTSGGSGDITFNAPVSVNGGLTVTSNNDVLFNASGDLTVGDDTDLTITPGSDRFITMVDGTVITHNGTGDVVISGENDFTVGQVINTGGGRTLLTSFDTNGDVIDGGDTGGEDFIGTVIMGGTGGDFIGLETDLVGFTNQWGGSVSFTEKNDIYISEAQARDSGEIVTIVAGGNLDIVYVRADGDINLTSTSGNVALGGSLVQDAAGDITINALSGGIIDWSSANRNFMGADVVTLNARDNIGEITDFDATLGTPLAFINVNTVIATTTAVGSEIYLYDQFPTTGSILTPDSDGAADMILFPSGAFSMTGITLNLSAGDRFKVFGAFSDIELPDAGITGTGDIYLVTSGDIYDVSGRDLTLTGANLTFSSNMAGGDTTLTTNITSIDATTTGAGNLIINETDGLSVTDITTNDGSITLTTTGTTTITNMTSGDNGDDASHNISVTNTSGDITATDITSDGDIVLVAERDINISGGALLTTGGLITLNADSNSDGGRISASTQTITSNGGNVTLGGGADPSLTAALGRAGAVEGISFNTVTINAGAGNVSMRGTGYTSAAANAQYGVRLFDITTITTTTGNITINGTGGAGEDTNYGVFINDTGTLVTTTSGTVGITGQGGSAGTSTSEDNHGITIVQAVVSSTGSGGGIGTVTLTGTGGAGRSRNIGVNIESSGSVESVSGNIVIIGDGATGANGFSNDGVSVSNSSISSTGTTVDAATISITGTGGAGEDFNKGIDLLSSASITSEVGNIVLIGDGGAGTGDSDSNNGVSMDNASINSTGTAVGAATITITGTGGAGDDSNNGIELSSGARINSEVGDIVLTGNAGAIAGTNRLDNMGIQFQTGASGIVVAGVGTANITLNGTSATNSTQFGYGVRIQDQSVLQNISGDININGVGYAADGDAIFIQNTSAITTSGTGNINFNGNSASAFDVQFSSGSTQTVTSGGGTNVNADITFIGDSFDFSDALTLDAGGTLTIRQRTAATSIGVGSGTGTITVDATDLGFMDANAYVFGNADTGAMQAGNITDTAIPYTFFGSTINLNNSLSTGALTLTSTGAITIDTTYTVNSNNGAIDIDGASLTGDNTNSITAGTGAVDIDLSGNLTVGSISTTNTTASALSITAGSITDAGDTAVDLIANGVGAATTLFIGGGVDLDTSIDTLSATTSAAGSVILAETDAITLTSVVTTDGFISATAGGPMTATLVTVGDNGADAEHDLILNSTGAGVVLGAITSDDDVIITAGGGSITDSNGASVNVIGDALTITAAGAITDIETTVTSISGSTSAAGDVSITETDAVTVSSLTTNDGSLTLSAGGDMTATTLTAADASDDETHNVTVTSTNGDLNLTNVTSDGAMTLRATRDINVTGGTLQSTGAMIINSDRDATGGGRVYATGGTITTGGGNLTIGGGADPTTTNAIGRSGAVVGIDLDTTVISTGAGNVSMRGTGYTSAAANAQYGIRLFDITTITTTTGNITINGTGGAGEDTNYGVFINDTGTVVTTTSGTVGITGQGGSAGTSTSEDNHGITIVQAVVNSTGSGGGIGTVTLTGTGGAGGSLNIGVNIDSNSSVESVSGDIVIMGNGATDGSGIGNDGVSVSNSSIRSTGATVDAATITITGTGGAGDDFNKGIDLLNNASITSEVGNIVLIGNGGAAAGDSDSNNGVFLDNASINSTGTAVGAATITITGTGGAGDDFNNGIELYNGARINSEVGDIVLTGNAGAIAGADRHYNMGIQIQLGASGIVVAGVGTANITLNGTSATNSTQFGYGVRIQDQSVLQNISGDININGVGYAADGDAIFIQNTSAITTSGTGNINFNGNSASAFDVQFSSGSTQTVTSGSGTNINADITFTGDSFDFSDALALDAGGTLTIRQRTNGTSIGVGSGTGTITVDATDLGFFDANAYVFGNGDTGAMQAGNITDTAPAYTFFGSTINLNNNLSTGALTLTSTGAITMKTTYTANSNNGAIDIDGASLMGNDSNTITAGTGTVDIDLSGNLTVGSISTTNTSASALSITAGSIIDAGDTAVDLIANGVGATTTLFIGGGVDLDTSIDTLSATTSAAGDVVLAETDGITVTLLNTNDGAITINSAGTTTLTSMTAGDTVAGDDHDISVTTTSGNIVIGSITSDSNVILTANTGSILDDIDDAVADVTAVGADFIAQDAIGTISDYNTSVGNSLDVTLSGNLGTIETTGAGSTIFIKGSFDIVGMVLTLDADGAADGILSPGGPVSLASPTLNLSSGDRFKVDGADTIILPDAGITTTGNIVLIASRDIYDVSGRDLTLNGSNLTFISGMAGGDITLTTNVDTATITTLGAGNVVINESDSITLTSVNTFDGALTVNASDTVTATNVAIGDDGNDAEHDVVITATNGITGLSAVTSDDDIVLTTTAGNLDSVIDGIADLVGDQLSLNIAGSVNVETNVNTLIGSTTAAGDVSVIESDTITVTSFVTNDGAFSLTSGGTTRLTNVIAGDAGSDETQDVTVIASAGDIEVGAVVADGDAILSAPAGRIIDISNDSVADITAVNATLTASDAVGNLSDFDSVTGNSLDLALSGSLSNAETTAANSTMFIEGVYAILGSVITPDSDGPAQIVLGQTGDFDVSNITLNTSAGDRVGLISSGTLIIADTGIAVSGDLLVQGATDIETVSDQALVFAADTLSFNSGVTLDTETLTTTVNQFTGTPAANTTYVITETDDIAIDDFDAFSLDVTAGGATTIDNVDTSGALSANSGNDINLGAVSSSAGNVTLSTTTGDVVDTNAAANNISADVVIFAVGGRVIDIETDVNTITGGTTAAGDVSINEANDVTFNNVTVIDGELNVNAGGRITADNVQTQNVGNDERNDLRLTADSLTLSNVTADGDLVLQSNQDVTVVTGSLQLNEDGVIDIDAANIVMADGSAIDAGAGTVDIDLSGSMILSSVQSDNTGADSINIVASAIDDAGDSVTDIEADGTVNLTIADGINDIETAVETLNATTTAAGDVVINEADGFNSSNITLFDGNAVIIANGNMLLSFVSINDAGNDSDNDLRLTTTTGDLTVGDIQVDNDVYLTTNAGSLVDGNAASVNVSADSLILDVAGGVNDIETDVSQLSGRTTADGDITINDSSSLNVNNMNIFDGDVVVIATGNLLLSVVDINDAGSNDDNDLRVESTAGDINLGVVTVDNAVDVVASNGNIYDNNGDANNIIATDASFVAETFIGDLDNSSASNNDAIDVTLSGRLTGVDVTGDAAEVYILGDFAVDGALSSSTNGNSTIVLESTNDLDVSGAVLQSDNDDVVILMSGGVLTVPDVINTTGTLDLQGDRDVVSSGGRVISVTTDTLNIESGGAGGDTQIQTNVDLIRAILDEGDLVISDGDAIAIDSINAANGGVSIDADAIANVTITAESGDVVMNTASGDVEITRVISSEDVVINSAGAIRDTSSGSDTSDGTSNSIEATNLLVVSVDDVDLNVDVDVVDVRVTGQQSDVSITDSDTMRVDDLDNDGSAMVVADGNIGVSVRRGDLLIDGNVRASDISPDGARNGVISFTSDTGNILVGSSGKDVSISSLNQVDINADGTQAFDPDAIRFVANGLRSEVRIGSPLGSNTIQLSAVGGDILLAAPFSEAAVALLVAENASVISDIGSLVINGSYLLGGEIAVLQTILLDDDFEVLEEDEVVQFNAALNFDRLAEVEDEVEDKQCSENDEEESNSCGKTEEVWYSNQQIEEKELKQADENRFY